MKHPLMIAASALALLAAPQVHGHERQGGRAEGEPRERSPSGGGTMQDRAAQTPSRSEQGGQAVRPRDGRGSDGSQGGQQTAQQRQGDRFDIAERGIQDHEDMSPGWSRQNPAVEGDAGRGTASSEMDDVVAQTTERTRRVLAAVDRAETAIQNDDLERARSLLDRAARDLRALNRSNPGADLLRAIERLQGDLGQDAAAGAGERQARAGAGQRAPAGQERRTTGRQAGGERAAPGGAELAPLFAHVRRQLVYADPGVVAATEEAQQRASEGDVAGATEQLELARSRVIADLAFVPVDEAYARVVAARAELEEGDPQVASRLLNGIPVVLQEIVVRAPLVPARFDLRAAAIATERGDQRRASELLGRARSRLEAQQAGATPEASEALQRLVNDVSRLQRRMASGEQVSPRDVRSLAQATRQIDVG